MKLATTRLALSTLLTALLAGGALPGCDDESTGAVTSDATATKYVDLGDFITSDADIEKWTQIRIGLVDKFDEICGDTFCGGDFSNIYSIDFTCSVSSKQGRIRECMWTFAASDESIDPATGSIASTVPFYECRVKPTGTVRNFLPQFGDDPLRSEIAGLDGSLYDAIGECFENPIGVTELPEVGEGPYADVADDLEEDEYDGWYAMTRALRQNFVDVCGDAFCAGDIPDIEPLRFRCSENTETGKIGTCAWVFGGAAVDRNSKGFLTAEKVPYVCTFPVDATPAEMAAALSPDAGGESPLYRPLPNAETSINDALIDCL